MSLEQFLADRTRGAIVTLRPDGRPHVSTVDYHFANGALRISTTADRLKTRNLQGNAHAAFYVSDAGGGSWVTAEGTATLSQVAQAPDDATVEELIDLYRSIAGEHPDWDEYRAAMVTDRRLVISLAVQKLYGSA